MGAILRFVQQLNGKGFWIKDQTIVLGKCEFHIKTAGEERILTVTPEYSTPFQLSPRSAFIEGMSIGNFASLKDGTYNNMLEEIEHV